MKKTVKRRRGGVNLVQSGELHFLFFFMMKVKRRNCAIGWRSEMKSASKRYGVPFSSINLSIFHGCGGLLIDQGMIKW